MDLATTPERAALRESTRRFLEQRSGEAEVRRLMESPEGYDPAVWRDLVRTGGVLGRWSPGGAGGGASFRDLAVVLEETGRSLVCGPVLSTGVLSTLACSRTAGTSRPAAAALASIAEADLVATVALRAEGRGSAHDVNVVAAGAEWQVSGRLELVPDGHLAEVVLVPATIAGEDALLLLDAGGPGVRREGVTTLDLTRRMAHLQLDAAPATPLCTGPAATALLDLLYDVAAAAMAIELIGSARRCVEMSAEYARSRKQFGVPIGTFQAVKHRCADMLAAVEIAQSTATYAAWCVDEAPDELPLAAAMTKSQCSETFRSVAADTIQIHGGIGFTWEHPAHLYYKRAKSGEILLGRAQTHRARVADLLSL